VALLLPPDKPPLVFSKILSNYCIQNDPDSFKKTLLAILFRIPDQIFFFTTIYGAEYYAFFALFLGMSCLLFRCWANLSFAGARDEIKVYRQLQVWEKVLNHTVKGRLFGIAMFLTPLMQVLSTALVLTLGHKLTWDQAAIIVTLASDAALFTLVTVSFAALILGYTTKWLIGNKRRCLGDKYRRRVFRSFRPLRVEFGNNYADKTTALVLQRACWKEAVSFSLVIRSK
jgi:hypothetical protein